MNVTTVGIDLAKNVFSVHGVDVHGKVLLRKTVSRAKLMETMANMPPCLVGIEACGGSHEMARQLEAIGHQVRLMAARFVVPYRAAQKNDGNDAAAICEAVSRPQMRFVPIKSVDQQATLVVHTVRQSLVSNRTGLINQLRGLLTEFGITMPKGRFQMRAKVGAALDDPRLPALAREVLVEVNEHIADLDVRILACDRRIRQQIADNELMQRVATIRGVGDISASAVVGHIGNGSEYRNGRHLAAWLGLVPRQHSTGGKPRLGRITRTGDVYIRTLLIHGARAALAAMLKKQDRFSKWAQALVARRGYKRAVVAIAAKNARIIWALLQKGESFNVDQVAA